MHQVTGAVGACNVTPRMVGILIAYAKKSGSIVTYVDMTCIHACLFHHRPQTMANIVVPNFTNRKRVERTCFTSPQQYCYVVHNDVLLAVIPERFQSSHPALISPKGVVTFKRKENARTNAPGTNNMVVA